MAIDPNSIYRFNSGDIQTHSTQLTNQRVAWLFLKLDAESMDMNATFQPHFIKSVYATVNQIWKNVRCFFENHPHPRQVLKLDTNIEGCYTIDLALYTANKQIQQCELNGWSMKKSWIIAKVLNQSEQMIRTSLQYFSYFIKSEQRQKPDISDASEFWKDKADSTTLEQLQEVVGKNNIIDWNALGKPETEDIPEDDDNYAEKDN